MATIQELEQKIQRLERELLEKQQKEQELLEKSEKALDFAMHAYRIDHNSYVWVWDTETQAYKKTNIHLCTPEVEDGSITERKMADDSVSSRVIQALAILEKHLGDRSVSNRSLQKECVSFDNLMKDVPGLITDIPISQLDQKYAGVTRQLDAKFTDITQQLDEKHMGLDSQLDLKYTEKTDELYSMIASLQVSGIALSQQFGYRTDIGISQKTLTKAFGRIWEILGEIKGKNYMDFTLTVEPVKAFTEGAVQVNITADSSEAVSDFDSIQIYVDDELKAESSDITRYVTTLTINETSTIKAIGIIMGRPITKEARVVKETPFFMGSGQQYTDIMDEAHLVQMVNNTIEGQYNVEVEHTGDHLFIIIPTSQKHYFRRADMNGWEIPMKQPVETDDYVVYESQEVYTAGTYNIDIDIDS